jgi:hypothetical protein
MSKFIIVSYFTINTPYQLVAHNHILPSLEQMKLKSDIRGIESFGSWQANTRFKPKFIREMMNKHTEDIVFIDSDADVLEYPVLFDQIPEDYDIAVHILDRDLWYNQNFNEEKEVLSGTLYIRNNDKVKEIVDHWIRLCEMAPEIWEQQLLQQVIKKNNVKVYELPISYCYIASLPDGREPFVKCDKPVIKHHQASRKFKMVVR